MKKLFIATCAIASIAAGAALADTRYVQPGPGLYKDDSGYSPAFPGADRWMETSRPVITEHQSTVITRQRALVPESAGELQSQPMERVIVIEPRSGYNMEGGRAFVR